MYRHTVHLTVFTETQFEVRVNTLITYQLEYSANAKS